MIVAVLMVSRKRIVALSGVASVALALSAVSAQATPRTLVHTGKPITSFAQSESTLAWRVRQAASLRLWVPETGNQASLSMFPGPSDPTVCILGADSAVVRGMVVGKSRAIWRWMAPAEASGCGGEDAVTFHAVTTGTLDSLTATHLDDWWQQYCPVNQPDTTYPGALDAAGDFIAYSTIHQGCPGGTTTGDVTYVDGQDASQRPIPGSPPAARLSVNAGRIAWIAASAAGKLNDLGEPTGQPTIAPNTPVEVFDWAQQDVVTQVTPKGTVQWLAVTRDRLAALVKRASGEKVIIRYQVPTGDRIGTTKISRRAVARIDMASKQIIFTVGRRIHAMNAVTGAKRLVATTASTPLFVSIAGHRLAWVNNTRNSGKIVAVNLR